MDGSAIIYNEIIDAYANTEAKTNDKVKSNEKKTTTNINEKYKVSIFCFHFY